MDGRDDTQVSLCIRHNSLELMYVSMESLTCSDKESIRDMVATAYRMRRCGGFSLERNKQLEKCASYVCTCGPTRIFNEHALFMVGGSAVRARGGVTYYEFGRKKLQRNHMCKNCFLSRNIRAHVS